MTAMDGIFSYKTLIRICFLIILGLSLYFIQEIQVNFEITEFRRDDNKDFELIQKHYSDFNINENQFFVAIPSAGNLFEPSFIEEFNKLCLAIDSIEGVEECSSLTNMKRMVYTSAGIVKLPYFHYGDIKLLKKDSAKLTEYPFLKRLYISDSYDALSIHITLDR